jgi:hypothetical protein
MRHIDFTNHPLRIFKQEESKCYQEQKRLNTESRNRELALYDRLEQVDKRLFEIITRETVEGKTKQFSNPINPDRN